MGRQARHEAAPHFSTGDPSYFVAASTPGSARPTVRTTSNAFAASRVAVFRFIPVHSIRPRAVRFKRHATSLYPDRASLPGFGRDPGHKPHQGGRRHRPHRGRWRDVRNQVHHVDSVRGRAPETNSRRFCSVLSSSSTAPARIGARRSRFSIHHRAGSSLLSKPSRPKPSRNWRRLKAACLSSR